MSDFQSALKDFWGSFTGVFYSVGIVDVIDILIVAYILYHGIRLVRETRAMQLVKGIGAILILYFVATQLRMLTLSFFIQNILQVGIFVLVVLFQPELRRALEQMGRSKLVGGSVLFGGGAPADESERTKLEEMIETVGDSCGYLSGNKTGALMVIERDTKLGEVIATGTLIDSRPSVELISNIFFTNSPLHDGAMILRDGRLHAAGCYLPLSQDGEIGRELGTRHRAALGMSEVSDAVVVVVSEETGAISVATDSRLQRGLSVQNLKKLLHKKLLGSKEDGKTPSKRAAFWKVKK